MTRRVTDYALGIVTWLVGSIHDEATYWRRRWNCRGQRHVWVCMTDAHVCRSCGEWNAIRACAACGLWL